VQWPTRPLPYGPRRPLMKINKKFALQLQKQDFYSFKLCTVDKVHAVRSVNSNNDMPFLVNKQKLFLYCCYKDWNRINQNTLCCITYV